TTHRGKWQGLHGHVLRESVCLRPSELTLRSRREREGAALLKGPPQTCYRAEDLCAFFENVTAYIARSDTQRRREQDVSRSRITPGPREFRLTEGCRAW